MSRLFLLLSVLVIFGLLSMPALAQNQPSLAQEVFLGSEAPEGSLVSLSGGETDKVELASLANGQYLFGVVSSTGKSLAQISSGDSGVPVVTSGDASVVVSTIYGDIKSGDVIGVSEVSGVAALADSTIRAVTTVGVALEDFNSSSPSAKQVESRTVDGEVTQITIGTIPVRLAVNSFFLEKAASQNILVTVGERIIGRPVSQFQAISAISIVIVSVLVGGVIVWNAVRGGFISIGRNPLSGNAVFNGVVYITVLSIAIMVGGFVSAYLILLL